MRRAALSCTHRRLEGPLGWAELGGRTTTKTGGKLSAAILVLALGAVALTGCGGLERGEVLTLGNIGWDENVAVASLTKVLLEKELGHERVEIRSSTNLDATYRGVASDASDGLDAFQDVWLPNQEDFLEEVSGDVEHLDPWFLGETR